MKENHALEARPTQGRDLKSRTMLVCLYGGDDYAMGDSLQDIAQRTAFPITGTKQYTDQRAHNFIHGLLFL